VFTLVLELPVFVLMFVFALTLVFVVAVTAFLTSGVAQDDTRETAAKASKNGDILISFTYILF